MRRVRSEEMDETKTSHQSKVRLLGNQLLLVSTNFLKYGLNNYASSLKSASSAFIAQKERKNI